MRTGSARLLGGERRQRARVDAAREQHADRDVRDEMRPHRVAQPRPALLDQLRLVVGSHGQRARPCEALECNRAVRPGEEVPRRQLPDLAEDRERRRHGVRGQERLEGVEVELALGERVELGGERELAVDGPVGERLDAEAVACEHEALPRRIPDREREHPAQPLREPEPPLLVGVDDRLGVRVRPEAVPGALEQPCQLRVVVDLAVLDDDAASVLVRDRLVAALEVDDREPPRGEPDAAVDEGSLGVRPAVDDRRRHLGQPVAVDPAAGRGDSADPAHGGRV